MTALIPIKVLDIESEIKAACALLESTMLAKYHASIAEDNQKQKRIAAQHMYLLAEGDRQALLRRL